jgi:CTP synthase
VGGTVGDLESGAYYEAIRQFIFKQGKENVCLGFVSYVPIISGGEQKTKPTQHGVRDLRVVGLQPDFLICRCEEWVEESVKTKISMFTNVNPNCVFSAHWVENVNQVPLLLEEQELSKWIFEIMKMEPREPDL